MFLWFTVLVVRCIRLGLPVVHLWVVHPGLPLRLPLLLGLLPLLGVAPMYWDVITPLMYVPIIVCCSLIDRHLVLMAFVFVACFTFVVRLRPSSEFIDARCPLLPVLGVSVIVHRR